MRRFLTQLRVRRTTPKLGKDEKISTERAMKRDTINESTAYALFVVNLSYIALLLLLSFQVHRHKVVNEL
jgi:hypothetical protein